jgi:hypothetical protein
VKPAFRYSDEDWLPIEACLAKLVTDAGAWRPTIEAKVHAYLWMTARTDPRSPEVVAAKACWKKLAVHLQGALDALAGLEAIETQPARTLGYAIARDPLNPLYPVWRAQIEAAERWARTAARGWPKSVRWRRAASGQIVGTKAGPNRSRGDEVDRLFADLLTFWIDRGGHVGKSSNSPSTRFVVAAVGQILPADVRLPNVVVAFARSWQKRSAFRPPRGKL